MTQNYDIIIVGAGMAGMSLACGLADSGLKIALLEGGKLPERRPEPALDVGGFDPRVSALTSVSQQFFEQLGVWDNIADIALSPYDHMCVWDREGTGRIEFDADLVHQPVLGHIVENRVSVWALYQRLQGSAVNIIHPARVSGLSVQQQANAASGDSSYLLELEDGRCLGASLLVAADGAVSTLRKLAGFDTREWDYQHTAIVATVETELPHADTARQCFLPTGPLALLPLRSADGGRQFCSIVWSSEPTNAEHLLALDDAAFCQTLGQTFEHTLGDIRSVSPRFSFPLRQRHARDYYRPGLALVGDAAHTIHPLAGQGINLGLKDVAVLIDEISRGLARGIAPGDPTLLARYQRRRLADNLTVMAAMEGFKRLFGGQQLPLRWLRNEGMSLLNRQPAIKAEVIRRAMGLS
ncbi:MAG: UbiH/UbiF/VisC/COQ6 family ubiquinone biosynthesis hydroxylase [Pseudomonadales bacterium]